LIDKSIEYGSLRSMSEPFTAEQQQLHRHDAGVESGVRVAAAADRLREDQGRRERGLGALVLALAALASLLINRRLPSGRFRGL
jgi:hypothetical protein